MLLIVVDLVDDDDDQTDPDDDQTYRVQNPVYRHSITSGQPRSNVRLTGDAEDSFCDQKTDLRRKIEKDRELLNHDKTLCNEEIERQDS